MKRFLIILGATLVCLPLAAQDKPARPRITGIARVRLYVTDFAKSQEFYSKLPGVRFKTGLCFTTSRPCFTIGWLRGQTVEMERVPATDTKEWLAEITFATDDIERMHSYLVANGVPASKISKYLSPYDKKPYEAQFEVHDPEGTPISFIQRFAFPIDDPPPGAPFFVQIIHAGLIVSDRAAEDRFYKDILDFRVYWHGGMKEGEDHWIDMQVPDGTDWLEYMLNVPANADHHTLGVMNHIALGVPDIHAAEAQLRKNGWTGTEQPKIGRDGKWQLNLYDPDDTRVEFMEFKPVQKPCCSQFTGPHPGPKQ